MEELTVDLFDPGMSPLHRAGLGGLAATIRWLDDERTPADRKPPGKLSYDDRAVTLSWESPNDAGAFLQKLYESAFDLDNGLIHLPGSYGATPPEEPVKAALQAGMSQTILQFGPNRKAKGPPLVGRYEADEKAVSYQYQNLIGYTHRSAWKDLVTSKGALRRWVSISGTIAPGFVQRHVAFPDTTIEQPPGYAIALHFALVGTFALAAGAKGGVLIVPEVEDLERFARRRALLNPNAPKYCRISSPADAALQAMVRLRGYGTQATLEVRRCSAVLFASQSWNEKQKTRAAVLDVEPDEKALELFEVAMLELPPRVVQGSKPDKKGEEPGSFWADSVVRPLIAENLARGRPWFEDFRSLIVAPDGKTDETRVRILSYEQKGLAIMIDQDWEDQGQKKLVEAVHDAMRRQFYMIWKDAAGNNAAYRNRLDRQMQRWRLAFAGAKTPDDVRNALTDMWSRSAPNDVLKRAWSAVLPLLCNDAHWKLNRDLALLALASYGGSKTNGPVDESQPEPEDDAD